MEKFTFLGKKVAMSAFLCCFSLLASPKKILKHSISTQQKPKSMRHSSNSPLPLKENAMPK